MEQIFKNEYILITFASSVDSKFECGVLITYNIFNQNSFQPGKDQLNCLQVYQELFLKIKVFFPVHLVQCFSAKFSN